MKLFSPQLQLAALCCFVGVLLGSAPLFAQSDGWNTQLSTSDGGFWKKRISFTIEISDEILKNLKQKNASLFDEKNDEKGADEAGMKSKLQPKEFIFTLVTPEEKTASEAKTQTKNAFFLPIAGAKAEEIRVCDAKQTEYLFEILDKNKKPQHEGVLESGAQLIIPIELTTIPQTSVFYVYYDNPRSWVLPDWWAMRRFSNGGFEEGSTVPDEWALDSSDAEHQISWSNDVVRNGKKSIKTVVSKGAEAAWIGARENSIPAKPGEHYRLSGWTRAENIEGFAGFFYHVGNAKNEMVQSGMLSAKDAAYDWKEMSAEFTIPLDCDRITVGTVLRGTGTAWYDDVTLELLESSGETLDVPCTSGSVEDFPLVERFPEQNNADGTTVFNAETFFKTTELPRFAFVKITNEMDEKRTTLVNIRASLVSARWRVGMNSDSVEILGLDGKPLEFDCLGANFFITPTLPARSVCYLLLVEKPTAVSQSEAARKERDKIQTDSAFPGTSLQNSESENPSQLISDADSAGLAILGKNNLVQNPGFETLNEAGKPEGWDDGAALEGLTFNIIPPDDGKKDAPQLNFGKNCAEIHFEPNVKPSWNGWRQTVKIAPNRSYFFGAWMKSAQKSGTLSIHIHFLNAENQHTVSGSMTSVSASSRGENEWTFVGGMLRSPADAAYMSLQLTVNENGVFCYDNVLVTEMETGTPERFQGGSTGIFQVPAIVKVFPDSTYPRNPEELQNLSFHPVTTAKNEEETVQFALRYPSDRRYEVELVPAASADGKTVLPTELYAVATVPVKHVTSYYNTRTAKWFRKLPSGNGSADGWVGYWPDPMIRFANLAATSGNLKSVPLKEVQNVWNSLSNVQYSSDAQRVCRLSEQNLLELKAWETRALCVIVKTSTEINSGLYSGKIRFRDLESGKISSIPFQLDVKNFAIPDEPVCGAIYDCRASHPEYWNSKNSTEIVDRMIRFLASKRLASDKMRAEPKFSYDKESGKWTADFTDFDAACKEYFDVLKIRWTYLPGNWYCFGWGMPPHVLEGEQPYEGVWPFADADRSKLRPEYKKIYQEKLRLLWNHIQELGYADRFVLYISDEPFFSKPEIIIQMKACCEMIQEAAPNLPIYSSTWGHVPEWDGYITAWGIGHYGRVPEEQIQKSKERGDHIWWTTDGQMCTDTPFCATERLLPYWCVKYGADAYEFWGASWYTYDPYKYGWHSYIFQSDQPGVEYYVLYPNGDGYIFYPDKLLGVNEIVTSIRLEQAREGVEDAAYLTILRDEIARVEGLKTLSQEQQKTLQNAKNTLARAFDLVRIPNAGGRYTSQYLPNPEEVDEIKSLIGTLIEALKTI